MSASSSVPNLSGAKGNDEVVEYMSSINGVGDEVFSWRHRGRIASLDEMKVQLY
jgi:hypothetical protein